MTNRKRAILLQMGLLFLVSFTIVSCCAKKNKQPNASPSALLQVCPEEWIQNKMPGTDDQEAKEYFILEGKRREIKEFDMVWVKKNCNIKPQIVQ